MGKEELENKIVGFITVPMVSGRERSFSDWGNSTISAGHIQFLRGIKWTALPYQSSKEEFDRFLERIDVFYISSGNVGTATSKKYCDKVRYCVNKIKEYNDNGIYFPIWGVCMGFQTLVAVDNNRYEHDDLLDNFDTWNNYLTNMSQVSIGRMNGKWSLKTVQEFEKTFNKIHNHKMGLGLDKYYSSNLHQNYKIIHINYDRQGVPFISTIEHNKYPFYAFQWHPEKSPGCEKIYDFFEAEILKTPVRVKKIKEIEHGNYRDCREYSRGIYENCYFFKK